MFIRHLSTSWVAIPSAKGGTVGFLQEPMIAVEQLVVALSNHEQVLVPDGTSLKHYMVEPPIKEADFNAQTAVPELPANLPMNSPVNLPDVGNPMSDSQPVQTTSNGMSKLFVPRRVPSHARNTSNFLDHNCSLHIWGCGPSATRIPITSPAKYGILGKYNGNTHIWHFDSLEMTWP